MKRYLSILLCGLFAISTAYAAIPLRQSTASQTVVLGPFVDTDGAAVTGLTIDAADVRISVNGGNIVGKNSGGCTHDELGMYACTFDATDTATVGKFQVIIAETGALTVFKDFVVLEEAVYDRDFAASATGIVGTAQTGDSYARLGAPAGASVSADIAAIEAQTDDIGAAGAGLTAVDDAILAILGTPTDFGSGTSTLAANLQDLADNGTATFDRSTDSLQAIRDRGDSAWTTGAGGCSTGSVCTTVATAPTTTSVTATAAPNSDTQLSGWSILFTNNGDADDYCLRKITGVSSGTISYDSACPFTVGAGDTLEFLASFNGDQVDVGMWDGVAVATPDTNGYPVVTVKDGTGAGEINTSSGAVVQVNQMAGTIQTLDALDTAQDTQHSTTQGRLPAALVGGRIDATVDGTGMESGAVAAIADGVWLEAIADHSGSSGSTAEALNAAGSAGDPWVTALPGAYSSGQAGYILGMNLNATVLSRSSQTSVDDLPTNSELATSQAAADDATLAAIATAQADLDTLTGSDGATLATSQPNYAPATAAALATVDGIVDSILVDTDTTIPGLIAALNDLSATDVGDIVIEDQGGGISLKCAMAVVVAYAAGDLATSGANSTYEDPSGTETRITGTVSSAGNRAATVTCPTY